MYGWEHDTKVSGFLSRRNAQMSKATQMLHQNNVFVTRRVNARNLDDCQGVCADCPFVSFQVNKRKNKQYLHIYIYMHAL